MLILNCGILFPEYLTICFTWKFCCLSIDYLLLGDPGGGSKKVITNLSPFQMW